MEGTNWVEEAKKICMAFQDPDRKVRKLGYLKLLTLVVDERVTNEDLLDIFNATHVYFLNGIRDKSEAVREEAVKFVSIIILKRYPLNDFYLTYIFPVFVERIGTAELVEESEEVRLRILQCLNGIVMKYSKTDSIRPFLNDCVSILCETLKDRFPQIKELSCETIINLANAVLPDFHLQAGTLLKPTLTCFSHQRYKVRVAAVRAVGTIVMHSSYKEVDEAVGPMAERLFDQNPHVRQAVAKEAANWLLQHRDRYSYFQKMIPLLLTGLSDEVEETRVQANELWSSVGAQYMQENEKEFKEMTDFLTEHPENYPSTIKRPNLGCRVLVQRNMGKLIGAITNELASWQEDVRLRCSQLLSTIVLHAEGSLTMHLHSFLSAMYSAARDDDHRVVENIELASKFIGTFINYDIWSKLIISMLNDEPHFGHLTVLAGIISGAPNDSAEKAVVPISTILASDRVACSRKRKYQLALLKCIKALAQHVHMDDRESNLNFFKIVTCLIALKHPENEDVIDSELYFELRLRPTDNFFNFAGDIYQQLLDGQPRLWTPPNDDACIFVTLLRYAATSFSCNIELITGILKEALSSEADAMLRLNIFKELSLRFNHKALLFDTEDLETVSRCLEELIDEVFVPSLSWHGGATAEAIRTMAITCLCTLLEPYEKELVVFGTKEETQRLLEKLPILLTSDSMEDASYLTRDMAVKCLMHLQERANGFKLRDLDYFLKVYTAMLKRLDDPVERVRLSAFEALNKQLDNAPAEFSGPSFEAQRLNIVNILLTHLDDDNEAVTKLAAQSLKHMMEINDKEVKHNVERQMANMRNKEECRKLLNSSVGDDDVDKDEDPGEEFQRIIDSSEEDWVVCD